MCSNERTNAYFVGLRCRLKPNFDYLPEWRVTALFGSGEPYLCEPYLDVYGRKPTIENLKTIVQELGQAWGRKIRRADISVTHIEGEVYVEWEDILHHSHMSHCEFTRRWTVARNEADALRRLRDLAYLDEVG